MYIRLATLDDLDEILSIYAYARKFMAEHGNPNQWGNVTPKKEQVISDIENHKSHLCISDEKIVCVFFFDMASDPTYSKIDGNWLSDRPYGVVHRIASSQNTKGAATFCLNWAYDKCKNLRIDTHEQNTPMRNLLNKLGFSYCGTICLLNGDPRRAYQKCDDIAIFS